jgi:hypothetical protein
LGFGSPFLKKKTNVIGSQTNICYLKFISTGIIIMFQGYFLTSRHLTLAIKLSSIKQPTPLQATLVKPCILVCFGCHNKIQHCQIVVKFPLLACRWPPLPYYVPHERERERERERDFIRISI